MPVPVDRIVLMDRMILIGPPGIGKTEVVKQLSMREARRLGRTFVDVRRMSRETAEEVRRHPERFYLYVRIVAPHVMPEDLSFPRRADDYVEFVGPREIALFTLEGIRGTIFIDEITNVARRDQEAMYYSILQEKEVGWGLKIRDEVFVVAAGNPPEVSSSASPLPAPLINRGTVIRVREPSIESWVQYMDSTRPAWAREAAAYLVAFPGDFYKPPKDTATLENFPTPRSWTRAAELLATRLRGAPQDLVAEAMAGTLGPEVGAKFAAFLRKRPPSVDEVLRRPAVLDEVDIELAALALSALAQRPGLIIERGERLIRYLAEHSEEKLVMMFKMMRRDDKSKVIDRYYAIVGEAVRKIISYGYDLT